MQGLKKYAPLGELRAALFSCLLSVEYISHHLDIKMQVALNPYYLAKSEHSVHIWPYVIADSGHPVIPFLTAGHLNFPVF